MDGLQDWQKAIVNAGIMGGITFFSTVVSSGGIITTQSCQTAGIAFGLTFLTLLSKYFRPPEGDCERKPKEAKETEKHGIGSILGCLWV